MDDIRSQKVLRVFKGGYYLEIGSSNMCDGWMYIKTGDFPSASMFGNIDFSIQGEFARLLAAALLEVADISGHKAIEE